METLESLVKERAHTTECNTLQIIACNAFTEPFTSASILTQEKLCTFRFEHQLPSFFTDDLKFDDVWDIQKLKDLMKQKSSSGVEEKMKAYHDKDMDDAFTLLEKYITDIDVHQESLKKVLEGKPDESAVVRVLAAHLFGPLSNGNYLIDNHVPDAKVCSCGCGRLIKQGNTGLGCDITWHGYVDMYIQERIPMSVVKNDPEDCEISERTPPGVSSENDEDEEYCWLSVEVKKDPFSVHNKGTSQLIAQTITNSFAQVNKNKALSGLPIPSFGCTSTKISIYSYDCENDILLKSLPLSLFELGKVNLSTVVIIWLYLHFFLFMNKNIANKKPALSKANFLQNELVKPLYSKVQACICTFGTLSGTVDWIHK